MICMFSGPLAMESFMQEIMALCDVVRQTGFELHRYLGCGHLEKVYENGLLHRLRKQGIAADPQWPLKVLDEDGTILGDYLADLFVDRRLLVEVKACRTLADERLLLNFGAAKYQVRKYVWTSQGHQLVD